MTCLHDQPPVSGWTQPRPAAQRGATHAPAPGSPITSVLKRCSAISVLGFELQLDRRLAGGVVGVAVVVLAAWAVRGGGVLVRPGRARAASTMATFVPVPADSDFPLQNLPWGVFSTAATVRPAMAHTHTHRERERERDVRGRALTRSGRGGAADAAAGRGHWEPHPGPRRDRGGGPLCRPASEGPCAHRLHPGTRRPRGGVCLAGGSVVLRPLVVGTADAECVHGAGPPKLA
jgi:hypothetical protein